MLDLNFCNEMGISNQALIIFNDFMIVTSDNLQLQIAFFYVLLYSTTIFRISYPHLFLADFVMKLPIACILLLGLCMVSCMEHSDSAKFCFIAFEECHLKDHNNNQLVVQLMINAAAQRLLGAEEKRKVLSLRTCAKIGNFCHKDYCNILHAICRHSPERKVRALTSIIHNLTHEAKRIIDAVGLGHTPVAKGVAESIMRVLRHLEKKPQRLCEFERDHCSH